jgi:hypothetical protein
MTEDGMNLYKWRKKPGTGSHSFKYNGKWIECWPGDTVICPIDPMGSFHVEYQCIAEVVDGVEKPISERPKTAEERAAEAELIEPTGLVLQAKGGGWYDVINPDNPDKPLNDKSMRKEEAEQFLGYLNEDG